MVTLKDIMEWIEVVAPVSLAESWDNVGLQIGDPQQRVNRVMTCLTVTEEVADQALTQGSDCIVAHHPLIFRPLTRIDASQPLGRLIQKLCHRQIAVYSCHTNYDRAPYGLNHRLAQVLKLTDARPLVPTEAVPGLVVEGQSPQPGLGRLGELVGHFSWDEYLAYVKEALDIGEVRIIRGQRQSGGPRRVAVCGGSGGSLIAAAQTADLYITGDVDYHDALLAQDLGLEVWDLGHFGTEKLAANWLAEVISQAATAAAVSLTVDIASEGDPFAQG